MSGETKKEAYTKSFLFRVLLKAGLLFLLFNLLFAWLQPLPWLGKLSLYNWMLPGRLRLPYGEDSSQSYNLSLNNLEAMFASHEISQNKAENEYRVLLLGDSSIWGFLLLPEETLASQLNSLSLYLEDGRKVHAYNLGYPTMSLTKDLILLDYAMQFSPDMIIWSFTLESFPINKQLNSPIPQYHPEKTRLLIDRYDLSLDIEATEFVEYSFQEQTLVGRKRALADLLRLQVYGIMWAVTGVDQYYPESYDLRREDFTEDITWYDLKDGALLTESYLAIGVLDAGIELVQSECVPILLVNEPMFISSGQNSHLHYNFFYPRHIYDAYREIMNDLVAQRKWPYLDLWNDIKSTEFTDSPVHLTPEGTYQLAQLIAPELLAIASQPVCATQMSVPENSESVE